MLAHRRWESPDGVDHSWVHAKHHFQVNAASNPAHRALSFGTTTRSPLAEALPFTGTATLRSSPTATVRHHLGQPLPTYLAVASGRIEIDGELMRPIDGVAIADTPAVDIVVLDDSELVLVETG